MRVATRWWAIGFGAAVLAAIAAVIQVRLAGHHRRAAGNLLGEYISFRRARPYDGSVPDTRELAAETDHYQLYIHSQAGGISVVDRRTGFVWSSIPPGPDGEQAKYACPISLAYIGMTNNVNEASNLTYSGLKVAWRRIQRGARVTYDATGIKIGVDVEYRLTPDGLLATIPRNGIGESSNYRVVSVRLLKNFGALPPDTTGGGLFVPDGCGAIRSIRPHRENLNEFGAYIYGPDYAVNRQRFTLPLANAALVPLDWKMPEFNRALTPRENLTLPVFGVYSPGGSLLGIIEKGDADCAIMVQDDGPVGVNYYRAGPEFFYRKADELSVIQAGQRTRPGTGGQPAAGIVQRTQIISADPEPIPGERRVAYHLLPAGKGGYGVLAACYRRYLQDKGILSGASRLDQGRMQLSILCAVDQNHQAGRRVRVMTTFAEARVMVGDILASEVDALTVTLVGWGRGGLYGRLPANAGAEPRLGGDEELRRFIAFCHGHRVQVQLELDYSLAVAAWRSYRASRDVAFTRTQDGILIDQTYPVVSILYLKEELGSSRRYLTNARAMWEHYVQKEIGQLVGYGADGFVLRTIGRNLWSDLSSRHHLTREEAIGYWRRILDAFRAEGKMVSVEYGQGYTLGHVDGIVGLALADSRCTIFDGPVPFLPMAIAGIVPYWGGWGNLRIDGRRQYLRELSYGAFPRYLLSYRPSSELLDTTGEDLAATSYKYWSAQAVQEWREVSAVQRTLRGRAIIGYEQPQPGCSVTEFSGGWLLLVNTTGKPATLMGCTVGSVAFTLVQRGQRDEIAATRSANP